MLAAGLDGLNHRLRSVTPLLRHDAIRITHPARLWHSKHSSGLMEQSEQNSCTALQPSLLLCMALKQSTVPSRLTLAKLGWAGFQLGEGRGGGVSIQPSGQTPPQKAQLTGLPKSYLN